MSNILLLFSTTATCHNKLNIINYSKPKYCSLQAIQKNLLPGQLFQRYAYNCILLNVIYKCQKKHNDVDKNLMVALTYQINRNWYYSAVTQEDLKDWVILQNCYRSKWHCINNDIGFFQGTNQVIIFKNGIEWNSNYKNHISCKNCIGIFKVRDYTWL